MVTRLDAVKNKRVQEVPTYLKDASYRGAKQLGHGQGYKYAHSYKDHYVDQKYMSIKETFYEPTEIGFEKIVKARLEKIRKYPKSK